MKATDLSKTTVTLDDSKVNYKKAGTYKATVIAKDDSNNETKKEIEIVVKEEKKETPTKKSNTGSSSSSSQSKKSSSKGSSSANSSQKSNSNSSSFKSNKYSDVGVGDSIEVPVDPDSYIEIENGNGSAWGGSFEPPKSWYDDLYGN